MDNKIYVVNAEGQEIEMEIILTFDNEELGKKYVLYSDPKSETGEVFASSYDDEGNLIEVTKDEEWAAIEEVFEAFINEQESEA